MHERCPSQMKGVHHSIATHKSISALSSDGCDGRTLCLPIVDVRLGYRLELCHLQVFCSTNNARSTRRARRIEIALRLEIEVMHLGAKIPSHLSICPASTSSMPKTRNVQSAWISLTNDCISGATSSWVSPPFSRRDTLAGAGNDVDPRAIA